MLTSAIYSAPGALILWTHKRKKIQFVDYSLCDSSETVDAAIVETGAQFNQLYQQGIEADRLVIGGTCDSVGVGGCWLGGCYGSFSKLYGSAASNMLAARVVLANGSLVTVDACSMPDLFWSLRGGGGGLGGVVTEFTVRAHRPPDYVIMAKTQITTSNSTAFASLLIELLKYTESVCSMQL